MNQEKNESGPNLFEVLAICNFVLQMVIKAYAAVVYAFVRRGFGKRYFGIVEFCGAIIPPLLYILIAPTAGRTMLPMLGNIYVLLAIYHRISAPALVNNLGVHSRYTGTPRIARLLPFSNEVIRNYVEPLFVVGLGFGFMPIDIGLAVFCYLGGFALLMNYSFDKEIVENRVSQILDAEIEDDCLSAALERARRR